jgi:2-dehydropantoate 2-reductase
MTLGDGAGDGAGAGGGAVTAGPVLVMGAGTIGCFVGGRLQAAGATVQFVGRPRVLAPLRQHGLTLTDLQATPQRLAASALELSEHLGTLTPDFAGLVLLCVKSGATAEAARALAAALPAGTPVLSLQNGVANAEIGAQGAPGLQWLPGMVAFNVSEQSPGHFHRGTAGVLAAQSHPLLRPWLPLFERAGLPLQLHADLRPVQWAKLLMNLNNPINALSGLPLRAQLLNRDYRRVLATLQTEALDAMQAAGIQPAKLSPLPPQRVPAVLRLPTWLFKRVAARMLRIDEKARSSMADDLRLGRPTEIDALCGAVVRLARAHGVMAPINARMVGLLSVPRPRPLSGPDMRMTLGL